jgi:threonine 3-dehydrogenase
MIRTMRALVKAEEGLWLEEVPEPEVGVNDVLIRVRKTGICGTDLHIYAWDAWARETVPVPMVVGHEFVGEVAAVGSNVTDFQVGALVSGEGHVVCGRCRNCMAGRRHLCAHAIGLGVQRPGAFAEYVTLPMTNIWQHWPGRGRGRGGDLRPVRQRGAHGALVPGARRGRARDRRRADRLHGCRGRPSRRRAARRRDRAEQLPARSRSAPRRDARRRTGQRDLADVQRELGMTEGFDVGLEMSGSAEALRSMIASMAHGGRIALLGIPSGEVAIDLNAVIFDGLTLRGIYGRRMYETWYQMTVMLQSGLDIGAVITHRFSHRDFEEAFAVARSGQSGKVVLDWTDA